MREEPLHIAVSVTSQDTQVQALAEALSSALRETEVARASEPIALPVDVSDSVSIEGADVVIALDATALDNTQRAKVGLRVAYWPGLGNAWAGSLESADLVLVTHETQVEVALARGALADRVAVVGPLASAPLVARDEARSLLLQAGPSDAPILLVPTEGLPTADLSKLLAQLALVGGPLLTLFDVGEDLARARELRQLIPRFGLHAALFSEADVRALAYRAASRVLAHLESSASLRALAAETPLVVLRNTPSSLAAKTDALAAQGLVTFAPLAALALALDEALASDSVERGRAAARALAPEKTPQRMRDAITRAWEASRSRGLPRGLEFVDRDAASALVRELEPLTSSFVRKKEREDAAIEAELAELKKRIGG
jgi:hypothetical protein